MVVDPSRWGEHQRELPELVADLQTAVVRRRKVRLGYANRVGERSERLVDPWGLVDKDDIWYLIAGTDAGQRTFRVDRIVDADVTGSARRATGRLRAVAGLGCGRRARGAARSPVTATVLIRDRLVPVLRDQFGRHCEIVDTVDDGRVRVRVAAPSARSIAEHLAGWGAMVQVQEPESVRLELARIGSELVEHYRAY